MKITFIYAYEGEEWSTPMALANEFKSREWGVEFVSIGSNRTGQYHDQNLQKWLETNPKTDIVLFMDWGRFDSDFLNKEELPNSFWIQESGDDPQNFERNSPKSSKFHLTITPDHDSYQQYKQMGRNVEWIPHFADTKVHFPIDKEPEYVGVTSRGLGGSQFLDYLTEWGKGAIGNKNGMDYKEHTEFLNSGLMVIQNSRWNEITRRVFEGMACKKLVLTDRLEDNKKLHELFEEGKEIVFYDDLTDCINKINYYHEHTEERNKIAEAGYTKVLEHYTQIQVVDRIINEYKKYKKIQ
jgi:spore maturation protein CgeB